MALNKGLFSKPHLNRSIPDRFLVCFYIPFHELCHYFDHSSPFRPKTQHPHNRFCMSALLHILVATPVEHGRDGRDKECACMYGRESALPVVFVVAEGRINVVELVHVHTWLTVKVVLQQMKERGREGVRRERAQRRRVESGKEMRE